MEENGPVVGFFVGGDREYLDDLVCRHYIMSIV